MTDAAKAADQIREWRNNPIKFVWDHFKVEPDAWQRQALEAFARNDPEHMRISLQACAGPGKTAVLAWCGWIFLSCHGSLHDHPKGAAVSVTADNLKDNLWPELAHWQGRSEFLKQAFIWQKERIFARDHPETWFLSARSWSKAANAEEQGRTLSGLHSKYVLVLVDESGDIPLSVLKAGEQAMGNCVFGKIVQAGNPTSHDGMLYAASTTLRHLWHVIRITGDPDDPDRSPRISIEWAQEQIRTYGRDNPWVMSYILGKFPPSSLNTLLGPDDVEPLLGRHLPQDSYNWAARILGVDVARFGLDRTVIMPRQGNAVFNPVIMRNASSTKVAARVAIAVKKWQPDAVFVDGSGGYGAGVIDVLRDSGHSVIEVQFGGSAMDAKFFNKRTEMWWEMAEAIKKGVTGMGLPNIRELVRELTAPQYYFRKDQIALEEKEQIKKRLGYSPDLADALALTYAQPVVKGISHRKPQTMASQNYDPYAYLSKS
ncbi:hypothetical protein [Pandoraea sputorum]|uniref:hypothetical protein n=1 Tax=Pandoraea sputorum TaxID=93222 RepID=UPI00123F8027|nr:hypothetical protein [Pandoraea sputorum]VVE77411.1 hypothetical protein PSP31120_01278 [Pandoraea sputorum]